eukprot:scaffold3031_cov102-Cylindrotheca_fusiformis.AAC.11
MTIATEVTRASKAKNPSMVRFDPRCRVRPILRNTRLPEPVLADLWYTRTEMKRIKQDCRNAMKLAARRGISFSQHKAAFRGLEMFHPKISQRRELRRIDGWDLVLHLQSDNRFSGEKGRDQLGKLYARLNVKSAEEARERAARDANDLLQPEGTWEIPTDALPQVEKMITVSILPRNPTAATLSPLMERTSVY